MACESHLCPLGLDEGLAEIFHLLHDVFPVKLNAKHLGAPEKGFSRRFSCRESGRKGREDHHDDVHCTAPRRRRLPT